MCGIAGIVALDGCDPRVVISMTHTVAYRGPDGYGLAFYSSGTNARGELIYNNDRLPSIHNPIVWLGSCRLAILGLAIRQSAHGDE
jgi:asparagine synthetase B (glutamine-hydrolysing)